MLSFEWRELESLCDKLAELRHRYAAAQRIRHTGLVEALKSEIVKARRQRDMLLQHITTRLAVGSRHHHNDSRDLASKAGELKNARATGREPLL